MEGTEKNITSANKKGIQMTLVTNVFLSVCEG